MQSCRRLYQTSLMKLKAQQQEEQQQEQREPQQQ
jgi:hypothetical protein